ncbi:MAG TPA: transcriptional repressor LexA [Gemmatimonadaceae bacterium]|nr:transcriptional repressor LexA [Gemmatimonadaceae bacterium]
MTTAADSLLFRETQMAEQLTKLESSVYHYLLDFTAENTYQPSIRDIGKQFKIKSTKTVSDLLQSLARKGFIERDPARSRGVNLLGFGAAMRTQPVPFYGKIHAGEPALIPEHRSGFITIDRRFVPSDDVFFLKVKGDSMVGRCINDGDYVMVNPRQEPHDNDIVAARLGEEATVKTYSKRNGSVVLEAANPAERDIPVQPSSDFGVLGVICGVFRPSYDANQGGNSIPA